MSSKPSPPTLRRRTVAWILASLLCVSQTIEAIASEPATGAPDQPVTVLVELGSPSAVEVYAREQAAHGAGGSMDAAGSQEIANATRAQIAAIAAEQTALEASLGALGAQTLYRAQRVYNGIAVRIDPTRLAEVKTLPGVRSVTPIVAKQPDLTRSVPFLGAPAVWSGSLGLPARGEGTTVAIIDTGIDYVHADFGGSGASFGEVENDPAIVGDNPDFPGVKVVGGFDFAGDHYSANPQDPRYNPLPAPDPDPIDCYGHGTHVAGIAAGYGVTALGMTFAGPWDSTTDFSSLRIGPGVAPLAQLYALKVFGCSGSSDIVDQAIEWAVDPNQDGDFADHVDIINLSLGSPFGSAEDTTSRAVEAAADVGVIVVASAGNSGDTAYTTGSPSVASSAISVAAIQVDGPVSSATGSNDDVLAGFSSRGPRLDGALKPDLAAPGVDILSAANGSGSGSLLLDGTSMAAPHVAGAMALLRQLRPGWSAEELKALALNTAAPSVRVSAEYTSTRYSPVRTGTGRIDLASALRSQAIAFNSEDPALVSLSFGSIQVTGDTTLSGSLRIANKGGAPLVVRPVYSAINDVPGVVVAPSGAPTLTVPSGAARTVAVRLHIDASELRNVRDATSISSLETPSFWQNEETGLLWLWPEPALFSATAGSGTSLATATLNVPTGELRFSIPGSGLPAASITSIVLARSAGEGVASSPAHTLYARSDSSGPTLPITGSVTLSDKDLALLGAGMLRIELHTSTSPQGDLSAPLRASVPPLKVAIYASPRLASAMQAASPEIDAGSAATATIPITLQGTSLSGKVTPAETRSLVGVLELHVRSPRRISLGADPTPGEIDFRYLGIGSDAPAVASLDDAHVFFGLAVWDDWATPGTVEFDFYVDSTGDDVPDYRVFPRDVTSMRSRISGGDAFVVGVEKLGSNSISIAGPLNVLSPDEVFTAPFDSNVMVLSVPAPLLGIAPGKTTLRIRALSYRSNGESTITGDEAPVIVYDVANPCLNLTQVQSGSPLFADAPGGALHVGFDLYSYSRSTAKGVLLLHLHNTEGHRAEAVAVNFAWPHELLLPLIESRGQ